MRKKILIVDDEKRERTKLIENLSEFEFEIFEADKIRCSLSILSSNKINILILDRKINSTEDGLTICNYIKTDPEKYGNPLIIILSRKISEEDITNAYKFFEINYYIRKPFSKYELTSLMKKYLNKIGSLEELKYKDLTLNIGNEVLKYNGEGILLSHSEFLILYLLFNNINKVVTKENFYYFCWNSYEIIPNKLKSLIYRVKQKHFLLKENIIVQNKIGYMISDK